MKIYGPGVFQMPPLPVAVLLHEWFKPALSKWGDDLHNRASVPSGENRVREAIRALDGALESLGSRKGKRADEARTWLESHHDRLRGSLAAFETVASFKPKLRTMPEGSAVVALAKRIESARAAVRQAEHDFENSPPAKVREARDALDVAEAAMREANREGSALVRSVAFPALPPIDAINAAKNKTAELAHRVMHGKKPATTLEIALAQGRAASADVARLWICFEPREEHQAWTLRAARFDEGAEAGDAPAPSAEALAS